MLIGAAEGLSFTVQPLPLDPSVLPPGGLRKNSKSVALPYAMGALNYKQVKPDDLCKGGLSSQLRAFLSPPIELMSRPSHHLLAASEASVQILGGFEQAAARCGKRCCAGQRFSFSCSLRFVALTASYRCGGGSDAGKLCCPCSHHQRLNTGKMCLKLRENWLRHELYVGDAIL